MALQPIDRDVVLRLVRTRGPVIPNELKRDLKQGDTVLLGAMLSELASKGLVKISKVKIGGSPFYYDPQQPATLEKATGHLNEKDQRTWRLLKERKVLRDDEQDALTRVSLRNIPDYSVRLEASAGDEQMIFWKYYLVPDEEAERLIKAKLGVSQSAPGEAPVERPAEKPVESPTPGTIRPEKKIITEKPVIPPPSTRTETIPPPKPEQPKPETKPEPKPRKPRQKKEALPDAQTTITAMEGIEDEFYDEVKRFFDKSGIAVKEQRLVKRKSELDFIILLPTPVGQAEYFCKARSKKRSNDGDLASAKLQGMNRHLPVVYLTNGDLTRKAELMLAAELKGVVVKRI